MKENLDIEGNVPEWQGEHSVNVEGGKTPERLQIWGSFQTAIFSLLFPLHKLYSKW